MFSAAANRQCRTTCQSGPTNTYTLSSPIGILELISCPRGLHALTVLHDNIQGYGKVNPSMKVELLSQLYDDNGYTYKPVTATIDWLKLYFAGSEQILASPTPQICYTSHNEGSKNSFSRQVWQTLQGNVPLGRTISYGELATLCSNPRASRAVGQAMRNNPILLVIPCHRVLLSTGSIGNYAGGGHDIKSWLLKHEKIMCS